MYCAQMRSFEGTVFSNMTVATTTATTVRAPATHVDSATPVPPPRSRPTSSKSERRPLSTKDSRALPQSRPTSAKSLRSHTPPPPAPSQLTSAPRSRSQQPQAQGPRGVVSPTSQASVVPSVLCRTFVPGIGWGSQVRCISQPMCGARNLFWKLLLVK